MMTRQTWRFFAAGLLLSGGWMLTSLQAEEPEKTPVVPEKTAPEKSAPAKEPAKSEPEKVAEKPWQEAAIQEASATLSLFIEAFKKKDLAAMEAELAKGSGNADRFLEWVKKDNNLATAAEAMNSGTWSYRIEKSDTPEKDKVILTVVSLFKEPRTDKSGTPATPEEGGFYKGATSQFILIQEEQAHPKTGTKEKVWRLSVLPM